MGSEVDLERAGRALGKLCGAFRDLASMPRWNDKIRPMPLWELDKQAHKAVYAYLLLRLQPQEFFYTRDMQDFHAGDVNRCWQYLFRALLYECLHRAYLTDLKPLVDRRLGLRRDRLMKIRQLAAEEYRGDLQGMSPHLEQYWLRYSRGEFSPAAAAIRDLIGAAHFLATVWEVRHVLAPVNTTDQELKGAMAEHVLQLRELEVRIPAVARLGLAPYSRLLDAVGRLRYQKRWGKEFRLPETTVLGHSLLVTLVIVLLMEALNMAPSSARLTVLTGLFHDLPEALVRDIPRPVRKQIADVVKEIEEEDMSLLLRGVDAEVERELRLFSGTLGRTIVDCTADQEEFSDVYVNEDVREIRLADEAAADEPCVRWGSLVKLADDFCAWLEAVWTVERGIRSGALEKWEREFAEELSRRKDEARSEVAKHVVELLGHAVAEVKGESS